MSKLTNLLEYSCAGNTQRSRLLNRPSFTRAFTKEEKNLLASEESNSTTLLQREIIEVIVEGAEARQAARNVLPIIEADSNKARLVYGASPSGQYASYVGDGAAIPVDTITYSKSDVEIKKAAVRLPITNELIEDCKFGVIELELKKAGAKLENRLNREAITRMLGGISGPSDIDPNGAHIGTYDLGLAKSSVDNFGWKADSFLIEPFSSGYLMDETNMSDVLESKQRIIGLNGTILDATVDQKIHEMTLTDTFYWDSTDAANHYQAVVFDSYNFAAIAMKEDINISEFNDPIHDLLGLTAKMRFGVGIMNADAGCRILSK